MLFHQRWLTQDRRYMYVNVELLLPCINRSINRRTVDLLLLLLLLDIIGLINVERSIGYTNWTSSESHITCDVI